MAKVEPFFRRTSALTLYNTIVNGLSAMKIDAEFSGKAEFKIKENSKPGQSERDVAFLEEYVGKYQLSRDIEISGVSRFDEPHLSVSKSGKVEPGGGTFVDYVITVLNDGNRALGPVYILDIFPPGTEYVYSSLRPSELGKGFARWTLVNLGIGASSAIELKLNRTRDTDSLINRVQASGGYDGQWTSAGNYSAIQFNWLGCCPPQIWADKTAYVDPVDPTVIHYSIIIRNQEKYVMAISIIDWLPGGLIFQDSSLMPSDQISDRVNWNIIDLKPGETRAINYLAKATYDGVFINRAHIEAHAVDGLDSAYADVASRVIIGALGHSGSSSTWQPPACFGLNCTSQETNEEWIPCDACGIAEPSLLNISCSSCVPNMDFDISPHTDDGYDMP